VTLLPLVAFAQAPSTFREAADLFVQILKGIINILFASLAVGLLYGVILYFINADNEKKRTEIRGYLFWGVIGITVAFSLWGILQILCNTLSWCMAGIPFLTPPA
jgi:FtsH-binding integral membrane protein